MTKHTYTVAEAPTNTGSLTNPARFNWRMDCPTRGRFWTDVANTRRVCRVDPAWTTAEVLNRVWLPVIEHVLRNIEWGSALEANYCRGLISTLPKSDHLVERAKRMAARGVFTQSMFEFEKPK